MVFQFALHCLGCILGICPRWLLLGSIDFAGAPCTRNVSIRRIFWFLLATLRCRGPLCILVQHSLEYALAPGLVRYIISREFFILAIGSSSLRRPAVGQQQKVFPTKACPCIHWTAIRIHGAPPPY